MMLFRALRSLAEARKMEKGDVLITRQLHPSDPKKDRTIIVIHGSLSPEKAADIQGILKSTHTAHRRPRRRQETRQEQQPMGGFIPLRFRKEGK